MFKKVLLTILITIAIFVGAGFVKAGSEHSVSKFAFSENFGWFSHNSDDTGSAVNYGVNLEQDGNLIGYAWSPYAGWIDYDPAGPYPLAPNHSAKYDPSTQEVSGWAKITLFETQDAIDGGWPCDWLLMRYNDGFISFGVSIDDLGNFSGYAWNNSVGWINYGPDPISGIGGVVTTIDSLRQAPYPPELIKPVGGRETWKDYKEPYPLFPTLDWNEFDDPNLNSIQKEYQIQVSKVIDFSTILYDRSILGNGSAHAYTPNPGEELAYNTDYYWRVRVKDDTDLWSDWGTTTDPDVPPVELGWFKTPLHALPDADFHTNPSYVTSGVETQFIDDSVAYGTGVPIIYWRWDFGDGTIVEGADPVEHQNPVHIYATEGIYTVSLTVRDSDGYEDTEIKTLNVQLPLPEFRRIIPR